MQAAKQSGIGRADQEPERPAGERIAWEGECYSVAKLRGFAATLRQAKGKRAEAAGADRPDAAA